MGGVLVGLGTRYANGCTSGHGICGLSRFSLRSLMAVCSFMGSAVITVYLMRHLLGVSA
ncbi:MAG: YeeE/YedE family protein [Fluviibacter sp.]